MLSKIGTTTLLLGIVALIVAMCIDLERSHNKTATALQVDGAGLYERGLAIEKAKANNSSTYSFTTGFIPGIGTPQPNQTK